MASIQEARLGQCQQRRRRKIVKNGACATSMHIAALVTHLWRDFELEFTMTWSYFNEFDMLEHFGVEAMIVRVLQLGQNILT